MQSGFCEKLSCCHFRAHENVIAIKDIITVPPNTTDFKVST